MTLKLAYRIKFRDSYVFQNTVFVNMYTAIIDSLFKSMY